MQQHCPKNIVCNSTYSFRWTGSAKTAQKWAFWNALFDAMKKGQLPFLPDIVDTTVKTSNFDYSGFGTPKHDVSAPIFGIRDLREDKAVIGHHSLPKAFTITVKSAWQRDTLLRIVPMFSTLRMDTGLGANKLRVSSLAGVRRKVEIQA